MFQNTMTYASNDLTACNFADSVAIHLHIVADTTFIVLNAADLADTSLLSFAGFYFLLLHCFPLYNIVCLLGLQWHIWKLVDFSSGNGKGSFLG
uniref:Uncharacterized protein n=1 Tax=Quercus lobata TaxID=97700 RepID=A0A7N2N0Y8_QUELO